MNSSFVEGWVKRGDGEMDNKRYLLHFFVILLHLIFCITKRKKKNGSLKELKNM